MYSSIQTCAIRMVFIANVSFSLCLLQDFKSKMRIESQRPQLTNKDEIFEIYVPLESTVLFLLYRHLMEKEIALDGPTQNKKQQT